MTTVGIYWAGTYGQIIITGGTNWYPQNEHELFAENGKDV